MHGKKLFNTGSGIRDIKDYSELCVLWQICVSARLPEQSVGLNRAMVLGQLTCTVKKFAFSAQVASQAMLLLAPSEL